jgi:hypothetical protein
MPNEPPDQWEVLVDYSKAVASLAIALLGVTVTFSDKLLSPSWLQRGVLIFSWLLLVLTTLSAALAVAFCINFLRNSKKGKASIFFANCSFFLLAASCAGFLALGAARTFEEESLSLDSAIQKTRNAVIMGDPKAQAWPLQSLDWQAGSNRVVLVLGDASRASYTVTLDTKSGKVINVVRSAP